MILLYKYIENREKKDCQWLRINENNTGVIMVWFGLVWFYGISTIVGYLMPNPLYTYILNIYDLVWLGFMAYQPL